jgi:hypothetical protein
MVKDAFDQNTARERVASRRSSAVGDLGYDVRLVYFTGRT